MIYWSTPARDGLGELVLGIATAHSEYGAHARKFLKFGRKSRQHLGVIGIAGERAGKRIGENLRDAPPS
jgi:hypothetical protein